MIVLIVLWFMVMGLITEAMKEATALGLLMIMGM
jgi:hypothetical protein